MTDIFTTRRLILKTLDASYTNEVLAFLSRNSEIFEPFDAALPDNYYPFGYIHQLLDGEFKLARHGSYLRFWIFEKTNPDYIIGTVAFHNIRRGAYQSFEIGYKFDKEYHHKGYATEAITFLCHMAFNSMHFHRIEAMILPENSASIRLLERIGFTLEGVSPNSICIQGKWRDHLRYYLLNES